MLMTMYNLCTIALLYDVRTPTEQFKRKIVSKKLTPACDVTFAAAWSPCSKLSAMKTLPKNGGHERHIALGAKETRLTVDAIFFSPEWNKAVFTRSRTLMI